MEAVLAAHAAAVAAEAVHVGEGGVLRARPPRPRVERVLLIDVVVISVPVGPSAEEERETVTLLDINEEPWFLH